MTLREQVEELLPAWQRWYPSVFEAARDLGLIRPVVCDPSTLLLHNRHSAIRNAAANAHREQWGGTDETPATERRRGGKRRKPARTA